MTAAELKDKIARLKANKFVPDSLKAIKLEKLEKQLADLEKEAKEEKPQPLRVKKSSDDIKPKKKKAKYKLGQKVYSLHFKEYVTINEIEFDAETGTNDYHVAFIDGGAKEWISEAGLSKTKPAKSGFDKVEYNRLDQKLNKLQGIYQDEEDEQKKPELNKQIAEVERQIHAMERPSEKEKYTLAQLGKAYEDVVGYDITKDDPALTHDGLITMMKDYDKENTDRPFAKYYGGKPAPKPKVTKTFKGKNTKELNEENCKELLKEVEERAIKQSKAEKKSKSKPVIEKVMNHLVTAAKQAIDQLGAADIKGNPKAAFSKMKQVIEAVKTFAGSIKTILGDEWDKEEVEDGLKELRDLVKELEKKYKE